MTLEAWTMLAILIAMFGLLVWNKLPAWIVFVGTLTVTMTLRLASAGELLEGFANTGVATVAGSSPVVTLIAYFSKMSTGVKTTTVCASS